MTQWVGYRGSKRYIRAVIIHRHRHYGGRVADSRNRRGRPRSPDFCDCRNGSYLTSAGRGGPAHFGFINESNAHHGRDAGAGYFGGCQTATDYFRGIPPRRCSNMRADHSSKIASGSVFAARLAQKTWKLTLDRFPTNYVNWRVAYPVTPFTSDPLIYQFSASPDYISLLDPLISVSSLTYKDGGGTTHGRWFHNADYVVDTLKHPGVIAPYPGTMWPAPSSGFWPSSAVNASLLQGIRQKRVRKTTSRGILLLVTQWYENRVPFEAIRFVAEPVFRVFIVWLRSCLQILNAAREAIHAESWTPAPLSGHWSRLRPPDATGAPTAHGRYTHQVWLQGNHQRRRIGQLGGDAFLSQSTYRITIRWISGITTAMRIQLGRPV